MLYFALYFKVEKCFSLVSELAKLNFTILSLVQYNPFGHPLENLFKSGKTVGKNTKSIQQFHFCIFGFSSEKKFGIRANTSKVLETTASFIKKISTTIVVFSFK